MSARTIALTGATGFVGKHLLKALLAAGYSVVALHRRDSVEGLPRYANLEWVLLDQAAEVFARRTFNATLHLATCYGTSTSLTDVVSSNVVMPLRLLELAIGNSCPLFVNTDTFFAKTEFNYPHMRPYIESKGQFIAWARLAATHSGSTKVVNARLEHVYGGGDGAQKFVPHVLSKLLANERLGLTPGNQRRDFVHVDDVVSAYLAILASSDSLSDGISEIQVGTGESHSIRTFVETARTLICSASVVDFGAHPHRDREIMCSVADTAALRRLGWKPMHSLVTGIRKILDIDAAQSIKCQPQPQPQPQPR